MFSEYFEKEFKIVEIKYGIQAKIYSKKIFESLIECGLLHGNKVKNQVKIPIWIFKKKEFLLRAVQGLFDTDGCVYNKYGKYAQIEFKFGCIETTASVHEAVQRLGFNPTKVQEQYDKASSKFRWRFYLSRQKEIDQFFEKVQPKNEKHILRYNKIRYGDTGIRISER